ncbi:MAG: DUF4178 domain-containing protein [Vulcanimicrobiota bacterium]
MNCPGCGAPITFRTERAFYSVCSSCGQMLIKREIGLELLGEVAECQPDGSLLQVGTRGQDLDRLFTVTGRTQLRYGDGFWNEWFLAYDDGSTGWLGEALGQYFISSQRTRGKVPSALSSPPSLGAVIKLDRKHYTALDRKSVTVSSYEGELPALARTDRPYLTVDLRSPEGFGLSVDYQTGAPEIFCGRWTDFSDLSFSNLKAEVDPEIPVASSEVRSVSCTGCGAPFELVTGAVSRTYVCQYCGTSMDSSHPELVQLGKAVDKAQELADSATLKLGMQVRLPEGVFRLIGFCESSTRVEGEKYFWKEYLLYHRSQGYRWLSQTESHFTLYRQLHEVPLTLRRRPQGEASNDTLRYQGMRFRHFQTSRVVTERVVGEFYWRLSRGATSTSWDYISPPYLLSASVADSDMTWSLGRYLNHQELREMIPNLPDLASSWTLAPNQPNPHGARRYLPQFALACLAALVMVSSGLLLKGEEVLWQQNNIPYRDAGILVERSFPRASGTLRLDLSSSDLKKRFVDINSTFTSSQYSKPREGLTRLSNPTGQGTVVGVLFLSHLVSSPGLLRLEARSGPPEGPIPLLREPSGRGTNQADADRKEKFHVDVKVTQLAPAPGYGWLFLAVLILSFPLLLSANFANSFEKRRWAESDYG